MDRIRPGKLSDPWPEHSGNLFPLRFFTVYMR
jgi:hypothetical protein